MPLLPNILDSASESLIVIQTSLATPWLPFLHALLASSRAVVICVGILHPPGILLPTPLDPDRQHVVVIDWTTSIPKYENVELDGRRQDLREVVLDALTNTPSGPVTLVVDSADTLRADLGSISVAYTYLQAWYAALVSRHIPARMILPLPANSPLLPRVLNPAFTPALVHLTLQPPKLLHHLATAHLAPAPPHPRFWALFSSAHSDSLAEQLVWGDGGEGWANVDVVIEILVRRARGRRVERAIEAWRPSGPCELTDLAGLRGLWSNRPQPKNVGQAVDPARDLPFNLALTDAQQRARAQVPLPYVHSGVERSSQKGSALSSSTAAISYDPDSADDLDEDDPDEDLDI